jgi:hypothetical protein
MCPGGRVVAATSEEGRVVTNGMSQYSRAEFNANSGLVVTVDPGKDYPATRWRALNFNANGKVWPLRRAAAIIARRGRRWATCWPGVRLRASLAR